MPFELVHHIPVPRRTAVGRPLTVLFLLMCGFLVVTVVLMSVVAMETRRSSIRRRHSLLARRNHRDVAHRMDVTTNQATQRREQVFIAALRNKGAKITLSHGFVTSIDATKLKVTLADLVGLRYCTKLETLVLTQSNIDYRSLSVLRNIPSLQELSLRDTKINDRAISNLRRIRTIRVLDLRGTKMTKKGIQLLKRAMPRVNIRHDQDPGAQSKDVPMEVAPVEVSPEKVKKR